MADPVARFHVVGTAHLENPDLFRALEAALDQADPDQLIVEIPDAAVARGEVAGQKPEMVCAYRWAQRRGRAVRGHEPDGPSILRAGLSSARARDLLQTLDRLIARLSVGATIDMFCARRAPATPAERRLRGVIEELVDPARAAARTERIIEAIGQVAAPSGRIVIVCGGAHARRIVEALGDARLIHGEYFF